MKFNRRSRDQIRVSAASASTDVAISAAQIAAYKALAKAGMIHIKGHRGWDMWQPDADERAKLEAAGLNVSDVEYWGNAKFHSPFSVGPTGYVTVTTPDVGVEQLQDPDRQAWFDELAETIRVAARPRHEASQKAAALSDSIANVQRDGSRRDNKTLAKVLSDAAACGTIQMTGHGNHIVLNIDSDPEGVDQLIKACASISS